MTKHFCDRRRRRRPPRRPTSFSVSERKKKDLEFVAEG